MKMRIALPLALAALPLVFLARRGAVAEVDAVSAASLTVATANITATTATINYSKDKYNYGTRTLCYDPAPATAANNCSTKNASGNAGSFNITGLTPNTQYNYSIKAIDTRGGERPYTSSGTFKTLTTAGIIPVLPGARPAGFDQFDAAGRRQNPVQGRGGEGVIFTNRMAQPTNR
ncbi:MAG: fibronectin type III domain-containing protein [Fibrobacteres bacterium]|nr:fibronectin type III domain-containing protein [Fibrobacterota bacterium]